MRLSRAILTDLTVAVLGLASSLLAHETGHVLMSHAVGAHPYFGLDHGRPTIYSGIDSRIHPQKLFATATGDGAAVGFSL